MEKEIKKGMKFIMLCDIFQDESKALVVKVTKDKIYYRNKLGIFGYTGPLFSEDRKTFAKEIVMSI
jgi:hypothetical protein